MAPEEALSKRLRAVKDERKVDRVLYWLEIGSVVFVGSLVLIKVLI
jgi:hypothetical protein